MWVRVWVRVWVRGGGAGETADLEQGVGGGAGVGFGLGTTADAAVGADGQGPVAMEIDGEPDAGRLVSDEKLLAAAMLRPRVRVVDRASGWDEAASEAATADAKQ